MLEMDIVQILLLRILSNDHKSFFAFSTQTVDPLMAILLYLRPK
jgi:hypothetical protein